MPHTSAVDFSDPLVRQAVARIGSGRKCAYLIALAAWQRGLTVEFFGNQADARVSIANMPRQVDKPELFALSDGQKRHVFWQSMGDATTPAIGTLARSKDLSKRCFAKARVPTPRGTVWTGRNLAQVRDFVASVKDRNFVLKPDVGSLRSGVQVGVTAPQVLPRLSQIGAKKTLVEEQIDGTEHRFYVVGGKAIAGHIKPGVNVMGNGRDTVAQLIHAKNALRQQAPLFKAYIIDLAAAAQYLAGFGQSMTRVPALGERVILSVSNNQADGGDAVGRTGNLDPDLAQLAIAACNAVGLPNAAIDIMVDGARAYVLEVNARAAIIGHSCVSSGTGAGNAVAEAIVDWYFPTPDGALPVRSRAMLDCSDLLAAFARDGVKTRFRLPPLTEQA